MAAPLKDFYDAAYIRRLGAAIAAHSPAFSPRRFAAAVFDAQWPERELKARMRHISDCLHSELRLPYRDALAVLMAAAPAFSGYHAMLFPDYVECHGLDHWDDSMAALAHFTRYSSSEFAVRPFIRRDPSRALRQLLQWSEATDEHVRRLASEGSRPRLPWAAALPEFKRDPRPALPILDRLRADPSPYVRRSVANHLNDIAKDNPAVTLDWAQRFRGSHPHTDWIIRHGCRTLLKRAHPGALALFAFEQASHVAVRRLRLSAAEVAIGDGFEFELALTGAPALGRLRLEYGIDFVKASGRWSRKLFKLAEGEFSEAERVFRKRHSFRQLTTRRHYPGRHRLVIAVNGEVVKARHFALI